MEPLAILTTIVGISMSFGYFTQTYKILKTKNVQGVSLATYLIFGTGIVIWLLYGLSRMDLPIIISNIVSLVGAGAVITAYVLNRR